MEEKNATSGQTTDVMKEMSFDEKMDDIRVKIKGIAKYLLDVKEQKGNQMDKDERENYNEIMSNLTLAYRHLEDASMRIGKVKQHRNGGESIYDKNVVGSK